MVQWFFIARPFVFPGLFVEFWGYTYNPEFPNMGNQFYRFF